MIKSVLKWLLFIPVNLVADAAAYILAYPLAAYSVLAGVKRLPFPFNYLTTNNSDLDGGQEQNGEERDVRGFKLFLQRGKWIMRNPAYTFGQLVLGEPIAMHTEWLSNVKGDRRAILYNNNGRFFSYQRDIYWSKTKYIKLWVGWHHTADATSGMHMYKCSINPFRTGVRPE